MQRERSRQAGVVLGATLGTLALRQVLRMWIPGAPWSASLYPAVVVSGWFAGAGAGLLATAVGLVALFIDLPAHPSAAVVVETSLFALNGALVSGFCQRLRR